MLTAHSKISSPKSVVRCLLTVVLTNLNISFLISLTFMLKIVKSVIFLRKSLDKRKGCVVTLWVRIYTKIYDVMGNRDLNSKSFIDDVKSIIDSARKNAVRSVDFCRVRMYWDIGKRIFEEEQDGKDRADYGSYLIKNLANKLIPEYGSGFSVRQL